MIFKWIDYTTDYSRIVDSWLDLEAKRFTGCDNGWDDFFDYWCNHEDNIKGENFWGKVVFEGSTPFAIITLAINFNGEFLISEYIVDPKKRGKGYGTAALRELLNKVRTSSGKISEQRKRLFTPITLPRKRLSKRPDFASEVCILTATLQITDI